jgi:hypothetical protein
VPIVLPPDLGRPERVVAECIAVHLGLRDERWEQDGDVRRAGEFTYARPLAIADTGLSNDSVKEAMRGLRDKRVIVTVERGGAPNGHGGFTATRYRLGTSAEVAEAAEQRSAGR